jgi:hypothetical protein
LTPESAPPAPLASRLALAFTPAPRRAGLLALAEVVHEIRASARAGIDHGVGHARLEWWQGEIERLASGRAQHPATRRLAASAGPSPNYRRLEDLRTAAELALVGYAPEGREELERHLDRAHGAHEILVAEVAAGASDPAPDAPLVRHGRVLGRGLGLAAALASGDAAILGAVADADLAAEARRALEAALALDARYAGAQVHGLVRARLALDGLGKPGGAPGALRQCLLAWREARRAMRT